MNSVSEKKNTELAALTLMDKLPPTLGEKKYAICVFSRLLCLLRHTLSFNTLS